MGYGDHDCVATPCDAVAQAMKSRQDRKFLRQLLRDTSDTISREDKAEGASNDHQQQDNEKALNRQPPEGRASKPSSRSDGEIARPSSTRAAIAEPAETGDNLDVARPSPVDDRYPSTVGEVLGSGVEPAGNFVRRDLPTAAGVVIGKAPCSDAEIPVGVERQKDRENSTSSIEELKQELGKAEYKDMPHGQGRDGASVLAPLKTD